MINFACKQFELSDIIRCSLGLTKAECKLFQFLLYEDESLSAVEIAEKNEVDRTTVQKAIKSLVEKGIVLRLQENLSKGGYIYRYQIKDKAVIRNKIKKNVSEWYQRVLENLDRW